MQGKETGGLERNRKAEGLQEKQTKGHPIKFKWVNNLIIVLL